MTQIHIGSKNYDVERIVAIHRQGNKAKVNISMIDMTEARGCKDITSPVVIPLADDKFKAVLVPYVDPAAEKQNKNPNVDVYILSKMVLKKADAAATYQTAQEEQPARFASRFNERPQYDNRRPGGYR
jgi:hypothetical protein